MYWQFLAEGAMTGMRPKYAEYSYVSDYTKQLPLCDWLTWMSRCSTLFWASTISTVEPPRGCGRRRLAAPTGRWPVHPAAGWCDEHAGEQQPVRVGHQGAQRHHAGGLVDGGHRRTATDRRAVGAAIFQAELDFGGPILSRWATKPAGGELARCCR